MKLQYIASSGNIYDLNARNEILTREANYHSWAWDPRGTELQYGLRLSNFAREAAEYSVTLTFFGSQDQRRATIDALHEDFEADLRSMKPGRVVWGDWYIDCFITESSTAPDERLAWTDNEVTLFCPRPFWIRESTKSFSPQSAPAGQEYLDYPYDYEYDYYYQPGFQEWIRTFPFASDFKMVIFGPASEPQITINGYQYKILDVIGSTEYIVIDSRDNTVMKHQGNGQVMNIFDLRNKAQSVFAQIPGGRLVLNWPGGFGFDLTLYEERSEPRA